MIQASGLGSDTVVDCFLTVASGLSSDTSVD